MKNKLFLTLLVHLIVTLVLRACGSQEAASEPTAASAETEAEAPAEGAPAEEKEEEKGE